MGILFSTLKFMAPALLNFIILWGIFFVFLSGLAFFQFGDQVDIYKTFASSMKTMLQAHISVQHHPSISDTSFRLDALGGPQLWCFWVFNLSVTVVMLMIMGAFLIVIVYDSVGQAKQAIEG